MPARLTLNVGLATNLKEFILRFKSPGEVFLSVMLTAPTCQYGSDLITCRSFNDVNLRIQRSTRKLLCLYGLWRPAYTRRREKPAEPIISPSIGLPTPPLNGVRLATWSIHSLDKK